MVRSVLAVAIVTAGCAVAPSPTQNGLPSPSPAPTSTPSATPVHVDPTEPPQTETVYGRIWDALPDDFPTPPGARPAAIGEGPASAILDVPGDATEIVTTLQSLLEQRGLRTVGLSGPLEDGSVVIESAGEGGCWVRSSVGPLGGTTIVTVWYGAACPFR